MPWTNPGVSFLISSSIRSMPEVGLRPGAGSGDDDLNCAAPDVVERRYGLGAGAGGAGGAGDPTSAASARFLFTLA